MRTLLLIFSRCPKNAVVCSSSDLPLRLALETPAARRFEAQRSHRDAEAPSSAAMSQPVAGVPGLFISYECITPQLEQELLTAARSKHAVQHSAAGRSFMQCVLTVLP